MMGSDLCFPTKFSFFFFFFFFPLYAVTAQETNSSSGPVSTQGSVSIGVDIDIGGESPRTSPSEPSPSCDCVTPPSPPGPSDFPDARLYAAYKVIQRFRQTVTCDPNGVTATWSGADICQGYSGFFCATPPDAPNGTVTIASVDFNGFGLCAPTVAGFLDALPDLALFHANSNNFTGTVPDLSKLRYLYELDVSNNRLAGPFPPAAVSLPAGQVLFLDLRFNFFSGTVPGSVFAPGPDVLFLNNNGFSQPLPEKLGATTASYLTLANNGFTGPIPRSIGSASATLLEVLFLNNKLCGCLPYEIGLLRRATVFDAGGNRLTGPIPQSFGCLGSVEQLNLAGNLLYGMVPEGVCALGNLRNLSLSDNYFTGVGGPACWKLLKSGVLDLRRNCVPGLPQQRSPAECVAFAVKPKYCPYWPSLFYVPCKPPCSGGGNNTTAAAAGHKKVVPAAQSPTYGALHRHHHRP